MMDLKNFKLLKEDDTHYQIQHPKGKILHVEKAKLNQKAHEMIKGMACGGVVSKMAGGGEIASEVTPDLTTVGDQGVPKYMQYSSQKADEARYQDIVGNNDVSKYLPPLTGPSNQTRLDQTVTPAPQEQQPYNAQAANQNVSPQQTPTDANIFANRFGNINKTLEEEKQIYEKMGNIKSGMESESAKAINETEQMMKTLPTQQQIISNWEQKNSALEQAYLNHHLDPDRVWHEKSTGSKIMAGIGLMISGIGSGLTGQPNLAMKVIDNAIDRDIYAQKQEQDKLHTLWQMNKDALGTDLAADIATKNQYYTTLKYKIMASTAQSNSAMARQEGLLKANQVQQAINQNNWRLALMSPSSDGIDPALKVPDLVPEPRQKEVFEEIKRAQNVKLNKEKILQAFDEAVKDNTVMRTGAGMLRVPGSVMALHQLIMPNFKSIDGTVRQAPMDETFHNTTPMPGDNTNKTAWRRKTLENWMESESAAPTAKGFGIDLQQYPSTKIEKSIPPPKGHQVVEQIRNGVKYQYNWNPKTGKYE